MENKQNNVLRVIYWKSKEVTVDEIMKDTSLKRSQIHRALHALVLRGFIIKRTDQPGWTDGKWHSKKSYVKLKNIQFTEKYLMNKELI